MGIHKGHTPVEALVSIERTAMNELEYAGFWIRTGAAIIDSIIMIFVIVPLLTIIFEMDLGFTGNSNYPAMAWDVL